MENAEVSREKLVSDLRVVIGDAEELLRATAHAAGETVAAARAKVQASMNGAKKRLTEAGAATVDNAKVAAQAADEFVHEHPWQAVGIGAAIGVILGMLISRR